MSSDATGLGRLRAEQATDAPPATRAERCPDETSEAGVTRGLTITVVGPEPPPSGGMAMQTEQLVALLRMEGATVTWVSTNPAHRPRWVARIRGIRGVVRLVPYMFRLAGSVRGTDVMHVMANSGWSWFLYAVPALLVARAARCPVVINYRGGGAERFLDRFGWGAVPFLRMAAVLAVPSTFLEGVFRRRGLCPEVVPNIVDVSEFSFRDPPSIVPRQPHLICARNLEPIYGNDIALHVFARIRREFGEARLTVCGSGPELGPLRRLADSLGIADAVTFPGRVERKRMAELMSNSDVLLNASRTDNMPNAVLEALAAGLPVVTTDAGGIPAIVTHEQSGLLCGVDDVEGLAAACLRVLRRPEQARALARAGRASVETCTWPMVRQQWAAIYGRLAGRRSQ